MTMLLEARGRSAPSSSYVVEWQMGDQRDSSAAATEGQPEDLNDLGSSSDDSQGRAA
ncbi:MAG: hypothetical protein M1435_02410 [Actinobacteria bacterium]|nr:hypothetical protein [Actinomycetota bacterium]